MSGVKSSRQCIFPCFICIWLFSITKTLACPFEAMFHYQMFHNSIGKIESERIVPDDTYVTFGGSELLAYHSFCSKTTKPIPTPENPEDAAGSVLC